MSCYRCPYWYDDKEFPYWSRCTLYLPCIEYHPETRAKQLSLFNDEDFL